MKSRISESAASSPRTPRYPFKDKRWMENEIIGNKNKEFTIPRNKSVIYMDSQSLNFNLENIALFVKKYKSQEGNGLQASPYDGIFEFSHKKNITETHVLPYFKYQSQFTYYLPSIGKWNIHENITNDCECKTEQINCKTRNESFKKMRRKNCENCKNLPSVIYVSEYPKGIVNIPFVFFSLNSHYVYPDHGYIFYRKYFFLKEHSNFAIKSLKYGNMIFSISKSCPRCDKKGKIIGKRRIDYGYPEKCCDGLNRFFNVIFYSYFYSVFRCSIPMDLISVKTNDSTKVFRQILKNLFPVLLTEEISKISNNSQVLVKIHELEKLGIVYHHKIGILLSLNGQNSEIELYMNHESTPGFDKFLSIIGNRIVLQDFKRFNGGLDVKRNESGIYSVYNHFHYHEIMYHVSTMLPSTSDSKVQLEKKRHIGNDSVTVIFQEGKTQIDPNLFLSQFQCVIIIVRPVIENLNLKGYEICVCAKPEININYPIGDQFIISESSFYSFFSNLIINANHGARRAPKLREILARTRIGILESLVTFKMTRSQEYLNIQPIEYIEREKNNYQMGCIEVGTPTLLPGSIVWTVFVISLKKSYLEPKIFFKTFGKLAISQKMFCILENKREDIFLSIPLCKIISWNFLTNKKLKIYFTNGSALSLLLTNFDIIEMKSLDSVLQGLSFSHHASDVFTNFNDLRIANINVDSCRQVISINEDSNFAKQTLIQKGDYILELKILPHVSLESSSMNFLSIVEKPVYVVYIKNQIL